MTRFDRAVQLEQEIDNINFEAALRARLSRDFPEQFAGNENKTECKLQVRYDTEQLREANAVLKKLEALATDTIQFHATNKEIVRHRKS